MGLPDTVRRQGCCRCGTGGWVALAERDGTMSLALVNHVASQSVPFLDGSHANVKAASNPAEGVILANGIIRIFRRPRGLRPRPLRVEVGSGEAVGVGCGTSST